MDLGPRGVSFANCYNINRFQFLVDSDPVSNYFRDYRFPFPQTTFLEEEKEERLSRRLV